MALSGLRAWLVERLTHALYLSLAALGVILLMRAFRPRVGLEHAVAAFVYTFSPFTTQFLLPSPYFLSYALAPWFAWIALRGVRDGDPWRWAAASRSRLPPSVHLNAATFGRSRLIPAALTALYVCAVRAPRPRPALGLGVARRAAERCSPAPPAILVLWFSGPDVSANLRTTELPEAVARTSSWSESWRGLGFWLTYSPNLSVASLRPHATALLHRSPG